MGSQVLTSLEKIIIPNSVTQIGSYVFASCENLKIIDFSSYTFIPTLSSNNSFNAVHEECIAIIPDNLYDEWISATNWNSVYTNANLTFVKASEVTE